MDDIQQKKDSGGNDQTNHTTNGKRVRNEKNIYKDKQDSFLAININGSINPSSHGSNYEMSAIELENMAF